MVCSQLISAANTFAQLQPSPSMLDITRAVCCSCGRLDSCPSLSMERFESLKKIKSPPIHAVGLEIETKDD